MNQNVVTLAELLLPSTEVDWQRARCNGDPNHEAWFPFPSQDFDYARVICAGCPIREACGDYATRTGQSGVWGGHEYDSGRLTRE
uniref:WhiB family transcriptional regulator n=1 Tax=Nocardia suismassiliense TaxID=2077092 RepID=UPI003F496999